MCEPARQEALRAYRNLPSPGDLKDDGTASYKDVDEVAYRLSQLPMGTSRPLKVIAVGAGFSGLALAHEVEIGKIKNISLTIYEKNSGLGGTWFENRYPGYGYMMSQNELLT
jgi:hypothetical protein